MARLVSVRRPASCQRAIPSSVCSRSLFILRMRLNSYIDDVAAKLGYVDMLVTLPSIGQEIEVLLPAEIPKVKSYIEFEIVRGVFVQRSHVQSQFVRQPPEDADAPVVLINPTLDIAETPGMLFVQSYKGIFWRDASQSALTKPKVFPYSLPA